MPDRPEGLSVIVPAHNESGAVADVLDRLAGALGELNLASEIILVDDGSTDGTADAVDAERYRLVRLPDNLGYGAALRIGAREALYDTILITDADGTYPAEAIAPLLEALADADMAIGARTGSEVHIPLLRRPAKWAITRLANYLSGRRIPDLNSGLRAVRRDVWERYEHLFPTGFSLTTTLTLAALVNGERVAFLPISYHARVGKSKIRPIRDTLNFIQLILRTILFFDPLKVFLPASAAFFLGGLSVGVVSLLLEKCFEIGQFLDVTTVLLCLTGVQLMAMGGLADLVTRRLR